MLTALPWGIATDPVAGQVYVADAGGSRVAVFNAGGAFVGELGRAGEGPGEFGHASALAMAHCSGDSCQGPPGQAGILVVLDSRRFVLSRWSSAGEFLGEERTPADYWGPGFAIGPDWFATVTSTTTDMRVEQRLEIQTGPESRTVHQVAQEMTMMELPCATMPAPRIFSPDVVWTRHGATFYYLNGPGYRIDAYTDGAEVRSLRRQVAPITVSRAMAVAGVQLGPGPYQGFMRQCAVSAEEMVDAVGHAERLAPVAGLAVDPGGRLWVARRSNGLSPSRSTCSGLTASTWGRSTNRSFRWRFFPGPVWWGSGWICPRGRFGRRSTRSGAAAKALRTSIPPPHRSPAPGRVGIPGRRYPPTRPLWPHPSPLPTRPACASSATALSVPW